MMRRTAFTLIEIMVAITIIVVLMSILLPGLSMMRNAQARNNTLNLMEMISFATTHYLADNGTLPASYATDELAKFLVDDPRAANQPDLVALKPRQRKVDQVLDAWGNPIEVTVDTQNALGQSYVSRIRLLSHGRKVGTMDNQIVFLYETDNPAERAVFRLQK